MQTLFSALVLVSSLSIIISVVLQDGEEGGAASFGSEPKPMFGKNKEVSKQASLQRITAISAAIFMISTLVLAAK